MSYPGRWSFWLADSTNMENIGKPLVGSDESASNLVLNDVGRNLVGTFSCSLPIDSEAAGAIQNHTTCIRADRQGSDAAEAVTRWSGFVNSIKTDVDAERVNVTAIGWFEELNQRRIRASEAANGALNFTGEIGGSIAKDLVDVANAQTDSNGLVVPTHVSFGTFTDTQVRTRTCTAGETFGSIIDSLSQVENGYDWEMDHRSRVLNIKAPDDYEDRPKVHYRYGVDMLSPSVDEDGTRTRNRLTIVGANNITVVVDDPEAIQATGQIIDDQISLSTVTDRNLLIAYGYAELAFLSKPPILVSFKPKSTGDVARPYDDFQWGDKIYATLKRGRHNFQKQPFRAFSGKYGFSNQGDEILTELTVALS